MRFEARLWLAAEKRRNKMDAAKHEYVLLTDDELAFYDALADNESPGGDGRHETHSDRSGTHDPGSGERHARLDTPGRCPGENNLVMVKRILNRFRYLPDLQEEAVRTVLRQAEPLCRLVRGEGSPGDLLLE